MDNRLPLRNWRLRLVWLRSLLVLLFTLALMLLQSLGHTGYHLAQLSWLGALLLPSLITLLSHRSRKHQSQLLTLELALDTLLFILLLQSFGGAGNPLSFYLLVPALLASLTLPLLNGLLVTGMALSGYLVTFNWYHRPASDTPLHALSHELSGLHSIGMAVVFVALLLMLTLLGQVIQRLMRQQQRQQEQALDLAGRREHMYQIAATLADQAHELNTPLGTLVMLADNLQHAPELPESLHAEVNQIDQLARSVSQRLKQNSAAHLSGPQPLSTLIEQLRQQLRHLSPTLQVESELDVDPVLADGESWFRILSNLGYNAMDAGASRWVIASRADEQGHLLQASDNGPAHPDTERQGLGMGLILVNAALEQMGASLDMAFGAQWTQVRIHYPHHALHNPKVPDHD
ncbi:HAMP domain-containing sensor histidine kinase [Alcanivorax sp. DP30]|uniref:sensor histidine kinase n=1 Tax=Alcanivorax sp. DP30 TaxID=2606217 RepID=UPI001368A34C|nr:HAMP domain-containing sensor histidine kinase [Alcanivorax sp. DP30]MZR62280.1 sensor histidine kinase [Alcanivorax sp. DP30]